jgi:hypothetical protein
MPIDAPLPIRQGGLMRCCIETWQTMAPMSADTREGDTLSCRYCELGDMIVKDGVWQWDHA